MDLKKKSWELETFSGLNPLPWGFAKYIVFYKLKRLARNIFLKDQARSTIADTGVISGQYFSCYIRSNI